MVGNQTRIPSGGSALRGPVGLLPLRRAFIMSMMPITASVPRPGRGSRPQNHVRAFLDDHLHEPLRLALFHRAAPLSRQSRRPDAEPAAGPSARLLPSSRRENRAAGSM